jgi:hypothetical protein
MIVFIAASLRYSIPTNFSDRGDPPPIVHTK